MGVWRGPRRHLLIHFAWFSIYFARFNCPGLLQPARFEHPAPVCPARPGPSAMVRVFRSGCSGPACTKITPANPVWSVRSLFSVFAIYNACKYEDFIYIGPEYVNGVFRFLFESLVTC